MQVFKVSRRVSVACEAKSTRSGFKHEATLLLNGVSFTTVKICYLNRTWERFTYQSVLEKIFDECQATLTKREIRQFKNVIAGRSPNYRAPKPALTAAA